MAARTSFLVALTLTATFLPARASAQGQFVCTEFIGYSQMGNIDFGGWGPFAAQVMVGGGPDTVQIRWQNGGAAFRWAGPTYAGWSVAPTSPCARSSSAPDRLILDITHNEYLTTARTNSDPVGFIETRIRGFLTQARAHHPSARSIVLQPVVGGPGHTTCPMSTAPEQGVVRASYNHPHIHAAIQRIVGGEVTMGYDSAVRACADYADWEGHLVPSASSPIGTAIGNFYLNAGGQTLPTTAPTTTTPPRVQPNIPNPPVAAASAAQGLPPQTESPASPPNPPVASASPPNPPVASAPPPYAPPPPQAASSAAATVDTPEIELWLVTLGPAQLFSLQMEPVTTAAPSEWYRVALIEDGWMLGVWEFDPPESMVWIELGPEVALTNS